MKKKISVLALSSILIAGSAWASAYRIPEQSVDSMAKAGANIASADEADASYYNPANMAWTRADVWQFEGNLNYIHLPSVSYEDNRTSFYNGSSESEHFLIPTVFLVSPDMNNFRFGFSMTAPYGLSKRWTQPFPRSYAEEYTLNVLDMNPSLSYQVNDMLSLGGGVRLLYSWADVSSYAVTPEGVLVARSMDGDTIELGYNLAASLRPTKEMNISMTYRSDVDLDLEGDVSMKTNYPAPYLMETGGAVSIPAPAVWSISLAYTFGPATVDLTWDRTFWSEYENISFNYDNPVMHPVLGAAFTPAIPKNWDDSSAYRIGLDYVVNADLSLMAGFAFDESPVPDETLGFELPDSDAYLYSLGLQYRVNEKMDIGLAYLYDYKKSRSVQNHIINGTFTDSTAHLLSVGLNYDF
ncbi:MAG: OmpP1/FadL family transporter [Thermodesulfobacteriota bacterium]